jgi:hypothetical protein
VDSGRTLSYSRDTITVLIWVELLHYTVTHPASFKINLLSTRRSTNWLLPFRLIAQQLARVSLPSHAYFEYMPHTCQFLSSYHPQNTWWWVNWLRSTTCSFLNPCHFMPLRFKYSPQYSVFCVGEQKTGESHFYMPQPSSRVANVMTKIMNISA